MFVRHLTTQVVLGLSLVVAPGPASAQEEQESKPKSSDLERTLKGIERIELMKRGLDSDKSLQPGGDRDFVPTVTGEAQTLPGRMIDLGNNGATESGRTAEWQSQNWLIHGVNSLQQGDSADENMGAPESLDKQPDQGSPEFWLELAMGNSERDGEESAEAAGERLKKSDGLSTVNPLDKFMTEWLSAEELARLEISDSSTNSLLGAVSSSSATELNIGESARMLQTAESLSQSITIPAERALNPYFNPNGGTAARTDLSGILPPSGSPVNTSSSRGRPLSNASQPAAVPTGNATAVKESREPWKPPVKNDEKYFRRLNRF